MISKEIRSRAVKLMDGRAINGPKTVPINPATKVARLMCQEGTGCDCRGCPDSG